MFYAMHYTMHIDICTTLDTHTHTEGEGEGERLNGSLQGLYEEYSHVIPAIVLKHREFKEVNQPAQVNTEHVSEPKTFARSLHSTVLHTLG